MSIQKAKSNLYIGVIPAKPAPTSFSFAALFWTIIDPFLSCLSKKQQINNQNDTIEVEKRVNLQALIGQPPLKGGSFSSSDFSSSVAAPTNERKEDGNAPLSYNGNIYILCSTRGDGACALHAILGKKLSSKEYVYLNDGRKEYLKKLQYQKSRRLHEHLISELKEHLGGNSTEVFSQDSIKEALLKFQVALDQELQTNEWLQAAVKEEPSLQRDIQKHVDQIETLHKEFVASPAVEQAYREVAQQSAYWFSHAEVEIIAMLFEKKVVLFHPYDTKPEIYHQNGKEEVVIYSSGNHYSRCEKSS